MGNLFGGGNMGGMMKQAKKMYESIQRVQDELAQARIEATSGGGMVTAIASGNGSLIEIKIDRQVVDPEDVEMLQDLVTTAVREALTKAKETETARMQEITGGLNIPGMF